MKLSASSLASVASDVMSDSQLAAPDALESSSRLSYGNPPSWVANKWQTSGIQIALQSPLTHKWHSGVTSTSQSDGNDAYKSHRFLGYLSSSPSLPSEQNAQSQMWGPGVTPTMHQSDKDDACKSFSRYGHLDSHVQQGHYQPLGQAAYSSSPYHPSNEDAQSHMFPLDVTSTTPTSLQNMVLNPPAPTSLRNRLPFPPAPTSLQNMVLNPPAPTSLQNMVLNPPAPITSLWEQAALSSSPHYQPSEHGAESPSPHQPLGQAALFSSPYQPSDEDAQTQKGHAKRPYQPSEHGAESPSSHLPSDEDAQTQKGHAKRPYQPSEHGAESPSSHLPSDEDAQTQVCSPAELMALTRACHLFRDQVVTMYTDSRHAFDFGQPGKASYLPPQTNIGDLTSSVASIESTSPFFQQELDSRQNEAVASRWASSSEKGFSEDLTETGTTGYYQSVFQSGQKLPETVSQTELLGPSSHESSDGNVAINAPLSSRPFAQRRLYRGSSDGVDTVSSAQGFPSPYTSDSQQTARRAQQSSSRHPYGTIASQLAKKGKISSLQSAVWSPESQIWGSGVTSTSPQPVGQYECKSHSRYGHLGSQDGHPGSPYQPSGQAGHPGSPYQPSGQAGHPGSPYQPSGQAGHPGSPYQPSGQAGHPGSPYQPSGQAGHPGSPYQPSGQAGHPGSPYQPSGQAGHPGSPYQPSGQAGHPGSPYQPSGQAGHPGSPYQPSGQAGHPGSPYQPSDQKTVSQLWPLGLVSTVHESDGMVSCKTSNLYSHDVPTAHSLCPIQVSGQAAHSSWPVQAWGQAAQPSVQVSHSPGLFQGSVQAAQPSGQAAHSSSPVQPSGQAAPSQMWASGVTSTSRQSEGNDAQTSHRFPGYVGSHVVPQIQGSGQAAHSSSTVQGSGQAAHSSSTVQGSGQAAHSQTLASGVTSTSVQTEGGAALERQQFPGPLNSHDVSKGHFSSR
ncbi:hypothetical protein P4O66_000204 [Electrophorus voltai]|uniref:Uncharacterized protein n=1 Tax=Electrophorus voltai TaxID=2609070 RepID=A0AAD9E0V3_9TELE|nr:hypothetical protein P4O66_000204 [Electrophorus voltai]